MTLQLHPNHPLPRFRADLSLYKGPLDLDGSPTYSLFDPVKAQYYKINWRQHLIVKSLRSGMTLNELFNELNAQTAAKVTRDDIKSFFDDALRYDLLEVQKTSAQLSKEIQWKKLGYLQKIFYKYLYVRIPILKPDQFLNKTLPYVTPLASRMAFAIYFIFSAVGIILLVDRFAEYVNTFAYFFNFNGMLVYIGGIILFKMVHEFAHAYTACYYKVHIPSMGVALILLVPVLYTDTTDGWKLSKRSDRLKISAAGLMSEIVLAGLCTFGWAVTAPGPLHSLFFVVSSVLWLSSVLINMNPAMRYDGYFLLSDWLAIDNLQPRAFNFTRWWVHHTFFGIERPCPEEDLTSRMKLFLLIYSLYTWIYRLFFYFGLAILLYLFSQNYKIVGVFIFVSTIFNLLVVPIFSEIVEIVRVKRNSKMNMRTGLVLSSIFILLLLLLAPLPETLRMEGIAASTQEQTIYAPEDSRIAKIYVQRGEMVQKDQPIIKFSSDTLEAGIAGLKIKKAMVEDQIKRFAINSLETPLLKETTDELKSISIQMDKLSQLKSMMDVRSDTDGFIVSWAEGYKVGQYVHKGMQMGTIANPAFKVVGFAPESVISHLKENQQVQFRSSRTLQNYKGYIDHIHPVRAQFLDYPSLASINKGDLAVLNATGANSKKMKLLESMYVIEIKLDHPNEKLLFGELGTIKAKGPWKSYLDNILKSVQKIFWRESGV